MAAVYLASDERLRRPVALKVLTPDPDRDPPVRARIIREAQAAAAVGHPHILPVYEAGEADGTVYLAMRYARGGDARSLIARLGPLPPGYAWRIIGQIASALDAAHARGVIHRDVRPANILLDSEDRPARSGPRGPGPARDTPARHVRTKPAPGDREPDQAYLADFGLGRVFPPRQIIAADQVAGMLDYLAPEQIEGRSLDGRADLYALACAAFELLCGTPPFGPDQGLTLMYAQLYAPPPPASGQRPGLSVAVDSVLATALAKNPDDRYSSCSLFARELRTALGLESDEAAVTRPQPAVTDRGPSPGRQLAAGRQMLVAGRRQFATVGERLADQRLAGERNGAERLPGEPRASDHPQRAAASDLPPGGRPAVIEERPAAEPVLVGAALGHLDGRDPGPHLPHLPRGRALRPVLAAGAVVAVIVAAVSGVALSKRSAHDPAPAPSSSASQRPGTSLPPGASAAAGASTAPTPVQADQLPAMAAQQAAALGTLLKSSAAARTALHQAVSQVSRCANLSGAVGQLQNVVSQRSGEYSRAAALPTSALPGGAAVKSQLLTALSRSLTADRDFLTWAQHQQGGGCTPGSQSGGYQAAFTASLQAEAAKQAFVRVWNPVAARYGMKSSSADDI
jgi:serine/threonine-protein kinase